MRIEFKELNENRKEGDYDEYITTRKSKKSVSDIISIFLMIFHMMKKKVLIYKNNYALCYIVLVVLFKINKHF